MFESVINYKGVVSIHVKDKPKVQHHNEGTFHLFNLLHRIFSKSVTELTDLGNCLPCYITLVPHVDNIVTTETLRESPDYSIYKLYSMLLKELPIVSKEVIDNTVKYNTLLTTNMLNNSTENKKAKNGYALLLNATCTEILAFSSIELSSLQVMYEDALGQADIDWELSFSNSTEGAL